MRQPPGPVTRLPAAFLLAIGVVLVPGARSAEAGEGSDWQDTQLPALEPAANLRVFLDCQASGCDFDLARREIPWVDWVRDREDADVHLLVTSTATGAGTAFDLQFLGRRRFAGDDVTLELTSSSTDTQDERRRNLIERFKLGLVRYAGTTETAEFLQVQFRPFTGPPQVTPEDDPWNLWVFTASVGGTCTAGHPCFVRTSTHPGGRLTSTTSLITC
jgi:hypothetical protein